MLYHIFDVSYLFSTLNHKRGKVVRGYFTLYKGLLKSKRIPSIFKDESAGSCICLWKLAVAVATYVSVCILYCILPSFVF
jgi:hypothetical protein